MGRLYLLLLLLTASFQLAVGQRPDFRNPVPNTTPQTFTFNDSLKSEKFEFSYISLGEPTINRYDFDTSEYEVHKVEPYYQRPFVGGNLGSEYSPSFDALFQQNNMPGIDGGFQRHQKSFVHPGTDRIIDVNRALVRVQYAKGFSINSSDFNVGFYRKFKRNLLLNMDYVRISDDSDSGLQAVQSDLLSLKMSQESKSGKRRTYALFQNSGITEKQSRGVVDNLREEADISLGRMKIEIGNVLALKDSIPKPASSRLITTLAYRQGDFLFEDKVINNSERSYFRHISVADTLTRHSALSSFVFDNTLIIYKNGWQLKPGLSFALLEYEQQSARANLTQLNIDFTASGSLDAKTSISTNLTVSLLDGSGDLGFRSTINRRLNPGSRMEGSLAINLLQPDLIQQNARVNDTTLWENSFGKMNEVAFDLDYELLRYRMTLGLSFQYLNDFVTWSSEAVPVQVSGGISILQLNAKKDLDLGPFRSSHKAFYQLISDDILLYPTFQYSGTIDVDLPIFRKKLDMIGGVDVHFVADFRIPDYNPVIPSFYNDGSGARSGHIILINPYLNVKLDKFQGFIKATNVTSRLNTSDFFFTKNYPVFDFRIIAGLRWDLYD